MSFNILEIRFYSNIFHKVKLGQTQLFLIFNICFYFVVFLILNKYFKIIIKLYTYSPRPLESSYNIG